MHILFLTENFPPETNASATRVFERARYWVQWGHRVTILTCAPNFPQGTVYPGYRNRWYQTEEMEGIRVVRVKTFIAANEGFSARIVDFLSFMVTAFIAGLFQKRPDVVVATSPQFFAAVAGWALAGVRRKPFVFELGDLWPASITAVGAMRDSAMLRMLERLELFLYRRSAAVVALTYAFRDDLVSRGIDTDKIHVVRNGVDLPRYGRREPDPDLVRSLDLENSFVIGYIGTHGMAHALNRVLDSAELLLRTDSARKIRFLFVGTGAARKALESEAHERQLGNVVFVPVQPKERVAEYWALCDVALVHLKDSPVFAGVIPSKIFEAMGMGLPVVLAAPQGEAWDIIASEGAGVCVPAESPQDLANAILALAEDPERLAALAKVSGAAAPRYSREKQAREMVRVLQHVFTKQ
ncbi:MAG: glycosyltransferase family 4 protein [Gammaproteobacteria bacterium]|nr:glycosyltransferase family 4 protein [Gammaproteobacteria bacterium]MCP5135969.1 glycosyltransferase family 4 protein [Gammaproteobacteria bacterium]